MTRKIALSTIAIVALTLSAFAVTGGADAQEPNPACPNVPYNVYIVSGCNGTGLVYPGLTPVPTATPRPTPKPTSSAVVSADTVNATGGGTGGNSIAFTGSESRVLGYAGAGLIGFGALALVAARRRSEVEAE